MSNHEGEVGTDSYRLTFPESLEEAARRAYMALPDKVELDEDGGEVWYYMVALGGRDEDGVYQLVLEGPAEGEKGYVYYYE